MNHNMDSEMRYPLIVSFYTNDWQYPQHAERLKKECDLLGLEHHIVVRKSAGGYLQNTCMKPFFIRECLELGRPILWIDVDGSILKKPFFFMNENYDFQAKRMAPDRKRTWHVGTMWFNPTQATKDFVDAWCENSGTHSDESALEHTIRMKDWGLRTRDIPPQYFVLYLKTGDVDNSTVICHRISNGESKNQQRKVFEDYARKVL